MNSLKKHSYICFCLLKVMQITSSSLNAQKRKSPFPSYGLPNTLQNVEQNLPLRNMFPKPKIQTKTPRAQQVFLTEERGLQGYQIQNMCFVFMYKYVYSPILNVFRISLNTCLCTEHSCMLGPKCTMILGMCESKRLFESNENDMICI